MSDDDTPTTWNGWPHRGGVPRNHTPPPRPSPELDVYICGPDKWIAHQRMPDLDEPEYRKPWWHRLLGRFRS